MFLLLLWLTINDVFAISRSNTRVYPRYLPTCMSRSRAWCFTINNYTAEDERCLELLDCIYVTYGRERGEVGTPHLQGFVYFADGKTFNTVRRVLGGRSHCEPKSRHSTFRQCIEYCHKDGDFVARGTAPQDQRQKGEGERDRWDEALENAKTGNVDAIPGDIYLRCYSSIKRIAQDHAPEANPLAEREFYGVWIHGPPRTGKSHSVRGLDVKIYLKGINKWWCGYKDERVVVIDEFEPKHSEFMTAFLKTWVDRWPFTCEFKGGNVRSIRPEWVIVTSNHPLENCFYGVDCEALKSRFKILEKTEKNQDLRLGDLLGLSPNRDVLDFDENIDINGIWSGGEEMQLESSDFAWIGSSCPLE